EDVRAGVGSRGPGDLPVRRLGETLPVAGGVGDQGPAGRGGDRRHARAVRGDRRHHDVVGGGARGPADAERRPTAGGCGAMEPDDDRSGTGLRHVALVRGRAAHGAPVAGRMLAGGAGAVAGIGGARIAVVRACGARVTGGMLTGVAAAVALVERAGIAIGGAGGPGAFLDVAGTRRAGAGASLHRIAFVDGRAAHGAGVARATGGRGGRDAAVAD